MAATGAATLPAPSAATRGHGLLSPAQAAALRDVASALIVSRLVIWAVGVAAALLFVPETLRLDHVDPSRWTAPFDSGLWNALVAPGARFDSAWLLDITNGGYSTPGTPAFFPLYPALTAVGGGLLGSDVVAGILLSTVAGFAGLYLLHRLVTLDFGPDVARRVIWITACLPTAFTFTAVYTESLFLLLSVGAIYAARLGRWELAALAAALAATNRSAGLLLVVPIALLYLYGPRADRAADRTGPGMRPRYSVRPGALAVTAPVLGIAAFVIYLGATTGDPLGMLDAQQLWERSFAPMMGLVDGTLAAGRGLIDLIAGTHLNTATPNPRGMGALNLFLFGSLVVGLWLLAKSVRRLPPAYTAYAAVSLALPLSSPGLEQPLMSMPRFMMVAFPLWITLALVVPDEVRWRRILGGSTALLAVSTALFTGWMVAP